MAAIDGFVAAKEHLVDVAKAAAMAALAAPQMTKGKTEIKTAIVTEIDDLEHVAHGIHLLCGPEGRLNTYMFGDYVNLRQAIDEGNPPVLLAVGGNAHISNLGWDCGGCGFLSCADYNKYAREHGLKPGTAGMGPSCMWKIQDIGLAAGYATAIIYEHHLATRVHYSYGAMSIRFGFLTGCSVAFGMMLGPVGKMEWDEWYNRPRMKHTFTQEDLWADFETICPNIFMGFSGRGKPAVKTAPNWFVPPIKYIRKVEDPAFDQARAKAAADLAAYVAEVAQKKAEAEAKK